MHYWPPGAKLEANREAVIMASIPYIFNQPGTAFVLLPVGIKFPPVEREWQNKPHTFDQALAHKGNVGTMAGNEYIGLDKDDPSAFEGLELPTSTTWETRPGRLGLRFKVSDNVAEALATIGKKPDQAQLKLYKEGMPCGEIKLQRTYQVIPNSYKFIDEAGDDVSPGKGVRVDYKLLQDVPPAEISLTKLLADLQALGITFSSKLEANADRLEDMGKKARQNHAESDEARTRRYAEAALQKEAAIMASAPKGDRNNQLYKSASNMGQIVAVGVLSEADVMLALSVAAEKTGLDSEGISKTILSGLANGKTKPRKIPEPKPKELWDVTPEEADALLNAVMEGRGMSPMSEEEFNAFKLDNGPKLTCNLPGDNFISRFMQYGSEISDAYCDYWFAGAIFALAVATDKKLKFELGQDTIYTNVFLYIAGGSTLARKTTALKKSVRILEEAVGNRLGISKVPNEFSPEAFIEHMDQFNHAPWIRDEAAGVLSLMRKDYMRGFKDTLMQLYDCTTITRMLRTSQRKAEKTSFNISDPFLNVFFASTDAALGANTEANDALSGFLARFLFFFPQYVKDCYMPLRKGTARHSELEEIAREQLKGIVALMDSMPDCVDMNYTPEAQAYYEEWQERREKELAQTKDGFTSQIFGRLMPAVVKLAMLFEVGSPGFDPSKPIGLPHFKEACRMMDEYFLPMARSVYDLVGQTEEKNVIDKIVAYLKRNGGRATQRETARAIKIKSKELAEYISTMLEYDMIERREKDNGGKGRNQVYLFLKETKDTNVPNVSNVSNVTKVPDKEDSCVIDSPGTLVPLVPLVPLVTIETLEPIVEESNPEIDRIRAGHQKHVAKQKRTCCRCGRSFPYEFNYHYNGDKSGYECATCSMIGPPEEPDKADSQTTLEAGT